MTDKVNVLGVKIDKITIDEAANKILDFTNETDKARYVFTPNSEMIMEAYKNEQFKTVLNSADILSADGIGVVYASKILKNPILERCAGYDIACSLLKLLDENKKSLYLFGSRDEVVQAAAKNINEKYKNINICGLQNGFFDEEKEKQIIEDINEKKPDVVFVCLGFPKQEYWIYNNAKNLNAKVFMGLGGSLDVFAGAVKRAPLFFQKLGIEWLYRLCKQPQRFMRMTVLPKFALTVIAKGKKYK